MGRWEKGKRGDRRQGAAISVCGPPSPLIPVTRSRPLPRPSAGLRLRQIPFVASQTTQVPQEREAGGIGNKVVNNFLATILELVRQCPTLSDRVGGVMNLLLLTQEEAALAGRPVNQPRMDTDGHGLLTAETVGVRHLKRRGEDVAEARHQTADTNIQSSDAGGTRPYQGGEEEFLRLLFEFTHSAQLNPDRTVALAAKRWERTLRFRLAVTRQRRRDMNCMNWHESKRAEAMGTRRACPSQSGSGKGGKEAKGAT